MTSKLHIGTIDCEGRVNARPVVATYAPDGTLMEWHPLDGHEPHTTVCVNTLLKV